MIGKRLILVTRALFIRTQLGGGGDYSVPKSTGRSLCADLTDFTLTSHTMLKANFGDYYSFTPLDKVFIGF